MVLLLLSILNRHTVAALLWYGIRHDSRGGINITRTHHDIMWNVFIWNINPG